MAKTTKKNNAPLYVNGRYVVEKQLPKKPAKGAKTRYLRVQHKGYSDKEHRRQP